MASIATQLLSEFEEPALLDLGCHAGAMLYLINNECMKKKLQPRLIGIEQDFHPYLLAREKMPRLTERDRKIYKVFIGNHSDLSKIQLYSTQMLTQLYPISILLLSNICELLDAEEFETVLEFAQERCKQVLIMGDIMNLYGDIPLLRRNYVLHPYEKILNKYGFNVFEKIFAPLPNMVTNGIIVAEKE